MKVPFCRFKMVEYWHFHRFHLIPILLECRKDLMTAYMCHCCGPISD